MQGFGPKVLSHFRWAQKTYAQFPMDTALANNARTGVEGAIFSKVFPVPLKKPELACYSEDVVKNILELDGSSVEQDVFLGLVSGSETVPGGDCLAHRYGGHQFGSWAGQLGDGRAHLIGEFTNSFTKDRWELQLKGSGLTPYSRFADGRAVVRSSVREFLCSEAMHHLGVPTSRAATVVTSPDTVLRDPHYDGHPRQERTAVVLRLAPCWFRFGSLQMLAADGSRDSLSRLADFVAERYYPAAAALEGGQRYSELARLIALRTAALMASWESVGFTHGVMNTDNMSVLGITIDYGPFGFLDRYDPQFVPNSSDAHGVYRYAHQARVGQWNVCRLWEALLPLMDDHQHSDIQSVLEAYVEEYRGQRRRLFAAKLGLDSTEAAADLTTQLLAMMEATASDFTMPFRELSDLTLDSVEEMAKASPQRDSAELESSRTEAQKQPGTQCSRTDSTQHAGSSSPHTSTLPWALQPLVSSPSFAEWLSSYRSELASQGVPEHRRQMAMRATNPRYVLRHWMAHRAGEEAEAGDYAELRRLHRVLRRPFAQQAEAEEAGYANPPPEWGRCLSLSCSS